MPRMYRSAAAVKKAIGGGASSETVPGAAELDRLLQKVKAPNGSSMGRIHRQTINGINLFRRGVMGEKTARAWVLALAVVGGFSFGSGLVCAPRKKEKKMQWTKKHHLLDVYPFERLSVFVPRFAG